jgi:SAM-dependent methyltransferase
VKEISPNDEMKTDVVENYYHWGLTALDTIRVALHAAQRAEPPRTILDFPCGHGRVLRALAATYPDAELTAADLNRDGVDFCARTFGATSVYSSERAEEVRLPGSYELIWVGSLFSHFDSPKWTSFLHLFATHLAPGGVLVFTTLGRCLEDEMRAGQNHFPIPDREGLASTCERDGFAYQDYVHMRGYGISLARPWWVCREVERHPEIEIAALTEGGWNGRQDAVACRTL